MHGETMKFIYFLFYSIKSKSEISKFYINLNGTLKFSSPEYQHEGSYILRSYKYYLPLYKVQAPGISAPLLY